MTLCNYCTGIPPNLFSFRRDEQCTYDHQTDLYTLEQSASTCKGCRLFNHAIEKSKSEHARNYALPQNWDPKDKIRLSSTKFGWQIVRIGWKEAGHFRSYAVPLDWRDHKPSESNIDVSICEARLIQRWTEICQKTHSCCTRQEKFLPTRLIDVESTSLVMSANISPDTPYIALSHCWGLTMPETGRTTSKTLEQHKQSIRLDDLPLTFQEFIGIARRLDIRYVWIDSLCIIQDSKEDWEKEAAMMASVYSNSIFTIAASASADGRGGCHVYDDDRSFGPLDLTFTDKVFRLWSRDPFPVGSILTSDPLMKRGWTLQERELSPRVVHFSRDTIRWECYKLRATIEFPWGDSSSFDTERLLDFSKDTSNDSKQLTTKTKRILSWMELVARYTNRSLTKHTDIMPAFSGIAQTMALQTQDEYFAGLWKSHLAHCLLWASNWHVGRGFKMHSRPIDYLAPSWSWASVKGPVHYLSWVNSSWHSFNEEPDAAYMPRLVDCSLTASSDPYGALTGGSLTLEGKVAVAYTVQGIYAIPQDKTNSSFSKGPQDRLDLWGVGSSKQVEKIGQMRYDIPLCSDCAPEGSMRTLWIMCCMNSERSPDGKIRTFAIVLQDAAADVTQQICIKIPTQYRRVGVAWGIDPSVWQGGVTTTITIV